MDLTLATTTLCQNDASEMISALGDNLVVAIVFGVGGIIAVVGILFTTLSGVANTKEREKTKREMAAYVAEGSMTPADAERLLRSDKPED